MVREFLALFFQLRLDTGQELRPLDDKALVNASANLPRLVKGGHGKGELAPLHGGELRLRPDPHPDRGGRVVGHVQAGAHRALVRGQVPPHRLNGGVFHQGDHPRGGEHRHQPGARRLGGVVLGDHSLGAAPPSSFNGHCHSSILFDASIIHHFKNIFKPFFLNLLPPLGIMGKTRKK